MAPLPDTASPEDTTGRENGTGQDEADGVTAVDTTADRRAGQTPNGTMGRG